MGIHFFSAVVFVAAFLHIGYCNNFEDIKDLDITIKDIFLKLLEIVGVSKQCYNAYAKTSKFGDMVDASAKIPNGIGVNNLIDVGNYDQCMEIFEESTEEDIYGKYCLTFLNASLPTKNNANFRPRIVGNDQAHAGIHLAYCTPNQCSGNDLELIINGLLKLANTTSNLLVFDIFCYTKAEEDKISDGGIATIALLVFFGTLVLISSLYDTYLRYSNKKTKHELLLAFSAVANGEKLFRTTTNPDQLLCLNGIRAISMMWVILGHEYSQMTTAGIQNNNDLQFALTDRSLMFLYNAPYSVDSFFLMGGLVTMYTFLKAHDKGVKFNIFLYYLHRYLRLTPLVAILILVHGYLLPHMGNGPFWGTVDAMFGAECREHWWSSLLYIQNYEKHFCIGQTWYLSVDMQLFLLSPFVLLPSIWFPKYRRYVLGALIVIGCIIPTVISAVNEFSSNMVELDPEIAVKQEDYMFKYYIATHCRFAPYILGFLFGDLIYDFKKSKTTFLNRKLALLLWFVGFGILWLCLYGPAPLLGAKHFDPAPHAFINGFGRTIWSLGLAIVIYLCVTGYGGPVDILLSAPIFQFLAKLSYSMYLIHYEFIGLRWASWRDTFYFSHMFIMFVFWGDFVVTVFISFFFTLTFESPILILEKYLLGGVKKTNTSNVKNPEPEVQQQKQQNNV